MESLIQISVDKLIGKMSEIGKQLQKMKIWLLQEFLSTQILDGPVCFKGIIHIKRQE